MSVINFGIKRPADFSPISDEILEKTIIPQFEQIVEKHAGRTAVKTQTHSLNYRQLNNAINDLAHHIIQSMGEDKSPVAFLLDDEMFSVIAFMAVLKSGRPYLGLHPSNSNEQLRSYLNDSTALLLIASPKLKEIATTILPAHKQVKVLYFDEIKTDSSQANPPYHVAPNAPFGIFYTSGSTGEPKGAIAGHLYKSQSSQYMNNEWFFSPSDRISLVTSVCFGASYPSIMGALLSGALLWIFDIKANTAQKALDWIIDEKLTIFRCTPSIFRAIFGLAPKSLIFKNLRFITLGGEPVSEADIDLFKSHTERGCVLINNFAATETGSICHYPVFHDTQILQGFLPAGYPAPGKEVMLYDNDGQPVTDPSEEGEIVVKSRFLNPGYWKQPELTAKKFRSDPTDPELRIYFSGDRGRWRPDGTLEITGRMDTQVKIRGFRIPLETIDLALRNLDGVKDAATIVHQPAGRAERLVAYVSMLDARQFSTVKFRKYLATQLPGYMIPSVFIQLDALPRTETGKLARLKLPEPSNQRPEMETSYAAPRNKMEIHIASIWQELLGLESVGINDSFFELGGDSLSVLEMTLEVEKISPRPLPQAFFKLPTISSLATLLESPKTDTDNEKFVIESYKKGSLPSGPHKKNPAKAFQVKKLVAGKYSADRVGKLVDMLVARYIVSKPYLAANNWSVKWSQNRLVHDFLYHKRKAIFSNWVTSIKDCQVQLSEVFQMSLLTNMNFGTSRFLGKKENSIKSNLQAYKSSPYIYWRTLGELLDANPAGRPHEHFPIDGIDHLLQARQQGRGVILLTFHGFPTPGRFFALERLLELDEIPTISYHIPRWQSRYHNRKDQMPETAASTLNAEIALFGQRKLQEGKIINIVSDTDDYQGRTYRMVLAGRVYQIKSGFAELAINTGAKIIPHFRHCLPDGKVQLTLREALDPGIGDRHQQVVSLLNAYAAFIENTWKMHPEAMRWAKIEKHFSRPLGDL